MIEPTDRASFFYDEQGNRTHVLLPFEQFERLVEAVEDAGLLRAMQATDGESILTLEQALKSLDE